MDERLTGCRHDKGKILAYLPKGGEAVEYCYGCDGLFIRAGFSVRQVWPIEPLPKRSDPE